MEHFKLAITLEMVRGRKDEIDAKLLQFVIHKVVLNYVPLSDSMYLGHMWTDRDLLMKTCTMVLAFYLESEMLLACCKMVDNSKDVLISWCGYV